MKEEKTHLLIEIEGEDLQQLPASSPQNLQPFYDEGHLKLCLA